MKRNILIYVSVLMLSLVGCKPDPDIDRHTVIDDDMDITFRVPEGWPQPFYSFQNNELTKERFILGRRLFYDVRLSRDNLVSCGSCHQQFAGFANADHDLSHGVDGLLGHRNSPPIFNMNWHTSFFWDGGVNHLESQPINPIENPVEMDETLQSIIAKVGADASYRAMFKEAWGDETITSQRIFKSLAQFMGMIVSDQSKYDKYMRNEPGGEMTQAELNGYQVYKDNCATCHTEPLFTDFSFRSNGLKPDPFLQDTGRIRITEKEEDRYKFKIPSLRNLKYTGPYMHDGRFNTLDEVLDHYATGIEPLPSLDPLLQNGIQLTPKERSELLQFLNTLNDEEFVKDKRFSEVVY